MVYHIFVDFSKIIAWGEGTLAKYLFSSMVFCSAVLALLAYLIRTLLRSLALASSWLARSAALARPLTRVMVICPPSFVATQIVSSVKLLRGCMREPTLSS